MRRKRWSLRQHGAGRTRIRLAALIAESLDCDCDPNDIWENKYPDAKHQGVCRWGVRCWRSTENGLQIPIDVASWDTMSAVVKAGKIAIVTPGTAMEICADN